MMSNEQKLISEQTQVSMKLKTIVVFAFGILCKFDVQCSLLTKGAL